MRTSWLKLAGVSAASCAALAIAPSAANAANVQTQLTILPSFTSTVPATPDPGVTMGRACIYGSGPISEDPAGACGGSFRNITPPLPAASATAFLTSATASETLLGGGNKSITANAFSLWTYYAEAQAKDPIDFGVFPDVGLLDVDLLLGGILTEDADHYGHIADSFSTNLTGELFGLTVDANGLGTPDINVYVNPLLTAQGWDAVLLKSQLQAQFALGSFSDFQLPTLTLEVPAGYDIQLTGTVDAVAAGVPEPAAWALMLGGFFGAGALLRARRRAALARA
ncbi:MAG: PEP-CTERM sorting domain-containing protein [Proteobacteria bacterium]|nr:PEP-CTERM sorting domain-containing protein [Pseudomonadota bacterium]